MKVIRFFVLSIFTSCLLVVCFLLVFASDARAYERIILPITINGQQVRLALDTCYSHTTLFSEAASRLRVKVDQRAPAVEVPEGMVGAGRSELCELTLGTDSVRRTLLIGELPKTVEIDTDGIFAWADIRKRILSIRQDKKEFSVLDQVPADALSWPHWDIRADTPFLGFEVALSKTRTGVVYIDTGNYGGVHLQPLTWITWVDSHRGEPSTLESSYAPGGGGQFVKRVFFAQEVKLADRFSIRSVPVMECIEFEANLPDFEMSLGLFALTRFRMIIDGKAGRIYIQPEENPTTQYNYNRLGAVFVSEDMSSVDLIAQVVSDGPAYTAGIRNGDVLTGINDLDATKWQTDPRVRSRHFWTQPAGTKFELSYRREGRIFKSTVELKEIFPGAVSLPSSPTKLPIGQKQSPPNTSP